MHRDRKEKCIIKYTHGDILEYNFTGSEECGMQIDKEGIEIEDK
jgi:hypothetical protein